MFCIIHSFSIHKFFFRIKSSIVTTLRAHQFFNLNLYICLDFTNVFKQLHIKLYNTTLVNICQFLQTYYKRKKILMSFLQIKTYVQIHIKVFQRNDKKIYILPFQLKTAPVLFENINNHFHFYHTHGNLCYTLYTDKHRIFESDFIHRIDGIKASFYSR